MLPLFDDGFVKLEEIKHQYFDIHGQEYDSNSKVNGSVVEPFDAKGIAKRMTTSKADADKLQAEWKATNKRSIDWGNMLHAEAENFVKFGSVKDNQFKKLEDQLYHKLTKRYVRNHSERVLVDKDRLIAGTVDHLGERSKMRNSKLVIDINDFKTNLSKGVRNDTTKLSEDRKEIIKFYNRYLLHPLSHLEASDYVKYCLQLSMYGVMLEKYGVRVGSMNIYYIAPDLEVTEMFVPYMRMEAITLMDNFIKLRKADGTPTSQYLKRSDANLKQGLEIFDTVEDYSDYI